MFKWIQNKSQALHEIIKEAFQEAFFAAPFRVIGITTDNLTCKAVFRIKMKKVAMPVEVPTQEIIESDFYFSGLSAADRIKVMQQYNKELKTPSAFIHEYPLSNSTESGVFRILLLDKRHIISGTAEYFFKQRRDIIEMLSKKDIVMLSIAYREQEIFEVHSISTFNSMQVSEENNVSNK